VDKILIIDDEKNIRRSLEMILESESYTIMTAENGREGLDLLRQQPADVVLLDLLMPEMTGIEVLKEARKMFIESVFIMMSGHGTIEQAVDAIKCGAYDFIEKPLTKEKILITIQNALSQKALRDENRTLKQEIEKKYQMVGDSIAISEIKAQINKVAPTSARVLILGESGTGKELVARSLHDLSPRKNKPFIKVNCAAIPNELIESELFGAVKGSYTGAYADRDGKFFQADRGTIFLDEIADMSLAAQAKVLRVLQEGEFEKVGGNKTIKVDVRVIAATNKNLQTAVQSGTFREDLYFRLNVIPITVPPLRERRDDIPILIDYFADLCHREEGLLHKSFSQAAMELLVNYDWPGNIRELRNLVERVLILSPHETIDAEDIPEHVVSFIPKNIPASLKSLKGIREEAEKQFIESVLKKYNGNISKTAQELGLERSTLHKRLKGYNIDVDSLKEDE
jgi:two-component system, NtrC family, nitrogen regulation response regulator NtrX